MYLYRIWMLLKLFLFCRRAHDFVGQDMWYFVGALFYFHQFKYCTSYGGGVGRGLNFFYLQSHRICTCHVWPLYFAQFYTWWINKTKSTWFLKMGVRFLRLMSEMRLFWECESLQLLLFWCVSRGFYGIPGNFTPLLYSTRINYCSHVHMLQNLMEP